MRYKPDDGFNVRSSLSTVVFESYIIVTFFLTWLINIETMYSWSALLIELGGENCCAFKDGIWKLHCMIETFPYYPPQTPFYGREGIKESPYPYVCLFRFFRASRNFQKRDIRIPHTVPATAAWWSRRSPSQTGGLGSILHHNAMSNLRKSNIGNDCSYAKNPALGVQLTRI